MLFLIAGLLCSAMVSIVLKASSRWEYDRYFMLAINYMACLIPFIISRIGQPSPAINKDFGLCIIFAAINGFLYLAGMVMNQVNVRRNGAILQSTFSRLGVMVPTCLSVIFFGERPSLRQLAGIVLVLASFCAMNMVRSPEDSKSSETKPVFSLLVLGLLLNGMADSNDFVYGCRGCLNNSSLVANSTILPKYITAMRSEKYLTTDKSCAINKTVNPNSSRNSFRIFITCA